MISEGIDGQVLVRAMYDFQSEDPTNLTFQRDDVIQVLAQLDSGWWAGLIDGRQGWFPSNYVELLDENDLDSEDGDEYVEGDDLDVCSFSIGSLPRLTLLLVLVWLVFVGG
jgi:hypothetical protein